MRSLVLVVVSYNWRSAVTWVSDKGGRVRGVAIVPFRKDGHHHTPLDYTANNFWKHLGMNIPQLSSKPTSIGQRVFPAPRKTPIAIRLIPSKTCNRATQRSTCTPRAMTA